MRGDPTPVWLADQADMPPLSKLSWKIKLGGVGGDGNAGIQADVGLAAGHEGVQVIRAVRASVQCIPLISGLCCHPTHDLRVKDSGAENSILDNVNDRCTAFVPFAATAYSYPFAVR